MSVMGRAHTVTRWNRPLPLLAITVLLASASALAQQYKADKAGPVPPEIASPIAQTLEKPGFQISRNGVTYCEIWLRTNIPSGAPVHEQNVTPANVSPANVTLANVPLGTLLGVIRFPGAGSDRRGQTIPAGVYTLRYALMPTNDSHQGAAPQRDFLLMTPAAEDRDLNAAPNFEALVAMSRKASHTSHPAVLSFWKADADSPGFSQQGDMDWVLQSKIGDTPIVIIVVGTSAS
jgi:hypothetical protein